MLTQEAGRKELGSGGVCYWLQFCTSERIVTSSHMTDTRPDPSGSEGENSLE